MNKELFAQMQIEAEIAALAAKLATLGQYIDPKSDYKKALDQLQKDLAKGAALMEAAK